MPTHIDVLPSNAHLIGFWLQIFATGAYFVYLPRCISIIRKKSREGMSIWMPLVCMLMFLIVTADLVVEMVRAYDAYRVATLGAKPDPEAYYAESASPLSLAKNSMTVALAIISDVIMVYRTFIVWNSSYLVILCPVGLLMAGTALGIWSSWTLSQTASGNNSILAAVSVRVKYFFIVTFCLNMLCAVLICYRIWRITSQVAASHLQKDRTVTRVFEVVIQTAAFYCAHLFIMIVADSVGSNVFFIFLNALPPVTALVFSMLLVSTRVKTSQLTTDLPTSAIRFDTTTTRSTMRGTGTGGPSYGLSGVEIDLERVVHTDYPTRTGQTYSLEGNKNSRL